MFELLQPRLSDLLRDAHEGRLQLPDFQRGWVWEENAVASLLASIARSFPVGAALTLRSGGEVRFKPRPVEGTPPAAAETYASELLLDGQQRTTSLYQALMREVPVETRDFKGKRRTVFYYFDIEASVEDQFPAEAVRIVDETRMVRTNIGRDITLDLSSETAEFAAMHFPANRIFAPEEWFNGWMKYWDYDQDKIKLFQEFQNRVINAVRNYQMPLIRLDNSTSREAVCLIFEKVNTGGKKLDAFELLTAMFAADSEVNLRDEWYGVGGGTGSQNQSQSKRGGLAKKLYEHDVLRGIERSDFLRAVSLAYTFNVRKDARAAGRTGKELPRISCAHGDLLKLPSSAWNALSDEIAKGFVSVARFLHGRGLFWWKDVPYPSQLVALATVFALRGNTPLNAAEIALVERWFWCGVFGELYGSTTDTRMANDIEDLILWLNGSEAEPRTIAAAVFSESRLDTLQIRISAAYKGLNALLMRNGASDFLTGERIDLGNFWQESFDIHHIFPRKWCEMHSIPRNRYNTIVNKSPISARTNRKIGGAAPSAYCARLDKALSQAGVSLDVILESHAIDPALLRADAYDAFYDARKAALLNLVEAAMGKPALRDGTGSQDEYLGSDESNEDYMSEAAE